MSVLRSIIGPSRALVVAATLAGVASGGAGVAVIALVQEALGRGPDAARGLAGAFAGLCLLAALTRIVAQAATIRLAHGSASRLGVELCRKVLALPLHEFEAIDQARFLAVLTEDIGIVAGTLAGLPLVSLNLSVVAVCLAYVGWLQPTVLASGVAFFTLAGIGYRSAFGRAHRQLRAARGDQDRLVGHYRTLIEGFRELKQNRPRREAFLARSLEADARSVRDRTVAGLTSFAVAAAWSQVAYFGFIGFVVFVLPRFLAIDGPALAGTVLVILYVMVPLDVLLMFGASVGRARASAARIEATIAAVGPIGVEPARAAPVAPPFRSDLRLEGVSFAYRRDGGPGDSDEGFTLGPVDLDLKAGEIVFVAGGNGSGKTTLIKLLGGLYAPDSGRVVLDGRPIGREGREGYRQLFSVVFADGHLFRDVHRADGDAGDLDDRASALIEKLGLAGQVHVEGGRFSTVDLSQGQRKRLALLSACLEDRPIVILDEWAANQDPASKRAFYLEILPDLRAAGRTLVVISHDEEYQDVADRVLRLRDGRLVADAALLAPA